MDGRFNKGDFTFDYQYVGMVRISTIKRKALSITDLNADGYGDLFWHNKDANKTLYQLLAAHGSRPAHLIPACRLFSASDDWNYSYQNADGDASLELVRYSASPVSIKHCEFWN